MPYKLGASSTLLAFKAKPALEGFEVEVNGDVPLSTFFDLQIWLSSGDAKLMRDAFLLFGDEVLMSWDLEDENGAVAATAAGMLGLPLSLALSILETWTEQIGSAPKVAGASQNGISPSVEELIETAT